MFDKGQRNPVSRNGIAANQHVAVALELSFDARQAT